MILHARSSASHTPFPCSTCYCTFRPQKAQSWDSLEGTRPLCFHVPKSHCSPSAKFPPVFLFFTTVKERITRFKFLGGCGNISGTSSLPLTSLCSALITNGINNLNKTPSRALLLTPSWFKYFISLFCFQLNPSRRHIWETVGHRFYSEYANGHRHSSTLCRASFVYTTK